MFVQVTKEVSLLRVGEINPTNPAIITWSDTIIDPSISCYRAACVSSPSGVNWLGGSEVTYNYNGIAYQGGVPVEPNHRILTFDPNSNEEKEESTEIGLKNLHHRLRLIYADLYTLNISRDNGFFRVELKINLA